MKRLLLLGGLTLLVLGGVYFYYLYDPAHSYLAPKCMFRMLTGWDCPSCGTQRALHALLHGEWLAALRLNPFMILSIPYAALLLYAHVSTSRPAQRLRRWVQHPYTVTLYLVLFVAWWIIRNTPIWLS